jgi:hypothetical protein
LRDQALSVTQCIRTSRPRWLALGLSLALAGCTSEWTTARDLARAANTTPPGANYKADIVAVMRTYLNDPAGVRGAFISEPALRSFDSAERYTVCLRYTARNSIGQYAASKDSLVLFREGRLDRVVDAAREACKDAAYQPFPELERLRR